MRIPIQLITLMRIRILPFNLMRINADPDPQHCKRQCSRSRSRNKSLPQFPSVRTRYLVNKKATDLSLFLRFSSLRCFSCSGERMLRTLSSSLTVGAAVPFFFPFSDQIQIKYIWWTCSARKSNHGVIIFGPLYWHIEASCVNGWRCRSNLLRELWNLKARIFFLAKAASLFTLRRFGAQINGCVIIK